MQSNTHEEPTPENTWFNEKVVIGIIEENTYAWNNEAQMTSSA